MQRCYVALGANLGEPLNQILAAYRALCSHPEIVEPRCASLYATTPVSSLPQPLFVNTVCTFLTSLSPLALFALLETIEKTLGKTPKSKEAPRYIDLDLLFYGNLIHSCAKLTLPHPKWEERLFVLRPLADLTEDFEIKERLRTFTNLHRENVTCLLKSSWVPALLKMKQPRWKLPNG